jgi:hypothetical protein
MVGATPNRCASRVVIGAAIIAATPAMAVLSPISVEGMPRFSRIMLRRGRPRPIAMPTEEIDEMAAKSDGQ